MVLGPALMNRIYRTSSKSYLSSFSGFEGILRVLLSVDLDIEPFCAVGEFNMLPEYIFPLNGLQRVAFVDSPPECGMSPRVGYLALVSPITKVNISPKGRQDFLLIQ